MRIVPPVEISDADRKTLKRWSRGRSLAARLVLRSKIVLLSADGKQNQEIAEELETTERTVGRWRKRFVSAGLAGIRQDAPRGGRPPAVLQAMAAEIIRKTTTEKPANATHWSTRSLPPSWERRLPRCNGFVKPSFAAAPREDVQGVERQALRRETRRRRRPVFKSAGSRNRALRR